MRFNHNNFFAKHKSVRVVIYAVASPVWVPIFIAIALGVLTDTIRKRARTWYLNMFGPSTTPHEWYAWRPVAFNMWSEGYGSIAWREKIWRVLDDRGKVIYGISKEDVEDAAY